MKLLDSAIQAAGLREYHLPIVFNSYYKSHVVQNVTHNLNTTNIVKVTVSHDDENGLIYHDYYDGWHPSGGWYPCGYEASIIDKNNIRVDLNNFTGGPPGNYTWNMTINVYALPN